jgi:hypothetical protein
VNKYEQIEIRAHKVNAAKAHPAYLINVDFLSSDIPANSRKRLRTFDLVFLSFAMCVRFIFSVSNFCQSYDVDSIYLCSENFRFCEGAVPHFP